MSNIQKHFNNNVTQERVFAFIQEIRVILQSDKKNLKGDATPIPYNHSMVVDGVEVKIYRCRSLTLQSQKGGKN